MIEPLLIFCSTVASVLFQLLLLIFINDDDDDDDDDDYRDVVVAAAVIHVCSSYSTIQLYCQVSIHLHEEFLWCQVHSSHIHSNHKASSNYDNGK